MLLHVWNLVAYTGCIEHPFQFKEFSIYHFWGDSRIWEWKPRPTRTFCVSTQKWQLAFHWHRVKNHQGKDENTVPLSWKSAKLQITIKMAKENEILLEHSLCCYCVRVSCTGTSTPACFAAELTLSFWPSFFHFPSAGLHLVYTVVRNQGVVQIREALYQLYPYLFICIFIVFNFPSLSCTTVSVELGPCDSWIQRVLPSLQRSLPGIPLLIFKCDLNSASMRYCNLSCKQTWQYSNSWLARMKWFFPNWVFFSSDSYSHVLSRN